MAIYMFLYGPASHVVDLCTRPEFIEFDRGVVALFPYPRKAEFVGTGDEHDLQVAFVNRLDEFDRQFQRWPGVFRLFFGHFGVAGAKGE